MLKANQKLPWIADLLELLRLMFSHGRFAKLLASRIYEWVRTGGGLTFTFFVRFVVVFLIYMVFTWLLVCLPTLAAKLYERSSCYILP